MLPRFLQPTPTLTDEQVARSLALMKWEGVLSGAMFSLASGGFLTAYALMLGANNFQIGLLAALPFLTQAMQIPGVILVERYRSRKALNVVLWLVAQLMWLPMALVPFVVETPGALAVSLVILFLGLRGLFAPIVSIAWNSWMRDLVPQSILGSYYATRAAYMTAVTAVVGIGAGYLIELWQDRSPGDQDIYGFSIMLIAGVVVFGLPAPYVLAKCSEPQMRHATATGISTVRALIEPWHDNNFKHLIRFLFVWSFASNLAIPFFAVYMLVRLEMSLVAVVALTSLSHAANVWFVGVWGRLADKAGNKTVLSLSSSLYLLVIVAWTFSTFPERHVLTIPLLVVLHIFAGFAAGGATVTAGTIALKTAPADKATPYLAVAAVATYFGQGLGPLVGGRFADFFLERRFTITASWVSPNGGFDLPALSLTGYDFLFGIAFILGLLSLNLLVALKEEGELPRDAALRELSRASALVMSKMTSSVPGLSIVAESSFGPLRKIPGLDVALGVTAYQIAASAAAAMRVATHGRVLARKVSHEFGEAVDEILERLGKQPAYVLSDHPEFGLEVARHAMRGAVIEAGESAPAARGAAVAAVSSLSQTEAPVQDVFKGVGYGAVEGALEGTADPGKVALEVIAGAGAAASHMGLDPHEAEDQAARGAVEAATAAGPEAMDSVREALSEDLVRRAEDAIAADEAAALAGDEEGAGAPAPRGGEPA